MDPDQAALLVRATARISAVILAANLIVAARRVGAPERGALRANEARILDIRLFVAFIISHTIHFICVGLLTIATAGANIDARTGYAPVVALGVLFYIACFMVLRVKRRLSPSWSSLRQRRTELWLLVPIWLAFFQALPNLLENARRLQDRTAAEHEHQLGGGAQAAGGRGLPSVLGAPVSLLEHHRHGVRCKDAQSRLLPSSSELSAEQMVRFGTIQ